MKMNRLARRFTTWIACFAILLVALAPSISHALVAASKPASAWTEVCTPTGLKVVKVPNEQVPKPFSSAKHDLHFEDCPFCQTQADALGPPPTAAVVPFMVSGSLLLPSLFYQSPHPLFVWAAAQSRAPPVHS